MITSCKSEEPVALEPLLTVRDVCTIFQINRDTLTRLVRCGEIPAGFKVGGSLRWRPDVIQDCISSRSEGTA